MNCIFCYRPVSDNQLYEIYRGGFQWDEKWQRDFGSKTLVDETGLEEAAESAEFACRNCVEALRGTRA